MSIKAQVSESPSGMTRHRKVTLKKLRFNPTDGIQYLLPMPLDS